MTIFYDFETSTSDLLGQILSYAFVITGDDFVPIETWKGTIKLNRTQIAEPGAILTNKLNIDEINASGQTEYEAAKDIHTKLESVILKYGNATLVGFNSNQFDLNFLRNLMIRYGLNPYFKGKLHNLDVLHWIQYIAFEYEDTFPWTVDKNSQNLAYYSFTLESTAKAFGVLTDVQSHDAEEDVLLLIKLIQKIQNQFGMALFDFSAVTIPNDVYKYDHIVIGKQKIRHFPKDDDEELAHFRYKYWLGLELQAKAKLLLDLEAFDRLPNDPTPAQILECFKYINDNKHFFRLEPLNYQEEVYFGNIVNQAANTPFIKDMTLEKYFKLTEKDWDIEYQIHQLGFERIDRLQMAILQLVRDPDSYDDIIKRIWSGQKTQKDKFLVQLFNRAYLAVHPSPKPEHLSRYMTPRYVSGALSKDLSQFVDIDEKIKETQSLISSPELSEQDRFNLQALLRDIEQKRRLF